MVTQPTNDRPTRPPVDDPRARILARLPLTERHVDAAGVATAVLEGGDGPPVVLLHGQGEFGATWMRVFPELVTSHRLIVPDLPGHGASGLPDGPLDADRVLDWLDELIGATCAEPPILAGHLLGGAIAARFAAARDQRISRLVLVDSLGLGWYLPKPRFAIPMVRFVAKPTERARDRLFDRCFVDFGGLRDEFDDMTLLEAYALDRAQQPQLQEALKAMMPKVGVRPIPHDDLAAITVPTTLIWGRHDLQVDVRVAERARARYGWPLHVIEGAADDPAVEQPDVFARAFRAAVDTAPTREVPA